MSTKHFLDYSGLQEVAGNVNTRLKTVSVMPVSASEGAVRLYVGETDANYTKGHNYQFVVTPFFAWKSPDSEQYVYTLSELPVAGDLAYSSPSTTATSEEVISYDSALESIELSDAYWERNTLHDTTTSAWEDITPTSGNFDFDNSPTKDSENLMKSGAIYNSITKMNEEFVTQNTSFLPRNGFESMYVFNNKLYAGISQEGLYVSTDGETFTLNTGLPDNYTVRSMYVRNNKLYVGTRNHGLYVSTDGETFTQNTSVPTNYTILSIGEFNGKLYVGTDETGFYVSTDGETFTLNASVPNNDMIEFIHEFNGKLYVGTYDNGLYVSADGETFTQNTSIPICPTTVICDFNGKLYIGTWRSGLYVSADGVTFTQNTGLPNDSDIRSLCEFNGKLYVGVFDDGVYTSANGVTFTQNTDLPTTYTMNVMCEFNNKLYMANSRLFVISLVDSDFVDELDKRFLSGESIPLASVEAMFD